MINYRSIAALIMIGWTLLANAQGEVVSYNQLSQILDSVEANNATLIALRREAEARKLENHTGITLADPEVGLKRMWDGAEQTGNMMEFTISQSVDLSTALGKRKAVARQKDRLVDEEYRSLRIDVLLDAKLVCIDLVYFNALAAELDRRLEYARQVVEAEKRRLESGDTDVLSYNNVLLSLSALEAERARVDMETSVLATRLAYLNGSRQLPFDAEEYASELLPDNFEQWYEEAIVNSPALAVAREEREARRSELSLLSLIHI